MRQSFASEKTICQALNTDKMTAREIRALVKGTIDPSGYPAVKAWIDQCYNAPSQEEQVMCALNSLLEGFGVEAIQGEWLDHYHQNIIASYVNTGDTYNTTIILDHRTDRYQLTSFGDFVERNNL